VVLLGLMTVRLDVERVRLRLRFGFRNNAVMYNRLFFEFFADLFELGDVSIVTLTRIFISEEKV